MHQAFVRKHRHLSIITLIAIPVIAALAYYALPKQYHRFTNSIVEVNKGKENDRVLILKKTWPVLKENLLLGVGVGDVEDEITPQWVKENGEQGKVFGPHNQYVEAWLSAGVAGLVAMLAMMLVPLIYAWRNKKLFMFSTMVIFSVSLLFESMLIRLMGMLFFCMLMMLFAIDGKVGARPE